MNKQIQLGFTVIELMITVAALAVMITIAVPSFGSIMSSNRVTTQANNFHSAILYARSEAVKRNVQVTMCGSSNPAAVNPCGTSSSSWSDGWLIFVDDNGNNQRDATETILRTKEAISGGSTLSESGSSNLVTYLNDGRAGTGSQTFKLCDADNNNANARELTISPLGSPRVTKSGTCP